MMKKVATIILNRNLPDPTNALVEHLLKYDGIHTDIFVLEAGSDEDKKSKYCTWYDNSEDTCKNGLRYSRGMNYALSSLWKEKNFQKYDAFFLLTNDAELSKKATIKPLLDVMILHQQVGILSPCSKHWGEKSLIEGGDVKYFWFIHNNAYFMRREFIEDICNQDQPDKMKFLFDGENFRGYMSEIELIAKAYANNWAAAITNIVFVEENESYLLNQPEVIKTESYEENMKLYIKEGTEWVKKKYGFSNRWVMQQYVRMFYESFFEYHPELKIYKI